MDFCSISSCFSKLQGSDFVFLSLPSEEWLLTGSAVAERFGSLTSKRDLEQRVAVDLIHWIFLVG